MNEVAIREARTSDAEALLDLKIALDRETPFMMIEPDERSTDPEIERAAIAEADARPNSVIFVADAGGELAGYLEARGGEFRRIHHSAYLVVGVRSSYQGQGLGGRLFAALEEWATSSGIRRIELTVRTDNATALRLYQRRGFEIEGTRRDSLLVDGEFIDEYLMARIIAPDFAAMNSSG